MLRLVPTMRGHCVVLPVRLEQLQAFISVAESGSFQAAARAAGLTQSAISRQVQALEAIIGTPLLHRSNPIQLTVAGDRLLPHAQRMCQEWQRAQVEIKEWLQGTQTELCVAGIHSLIAYHLPPVLEKFAHLHPNVQLRVTALGSDRALKVLKDGLVDLALVMDNPLLTRNSALHIEPLYTEPVEVLLAASHPLAQYAELPWSVLAAYPQAVFKDGYAMRSRLEQHFSQQGLSLKPALELNTLDAFRGVVKHSQLIALLPRSALAHCSQDPDLAIRGIANPQLERQVVMVTTPDRASIAPIRDFLRLALDMIPPQVSAA